MEYKCQYKPDNAQYIVSWLHGGFDAESDWEAFETLEDAKLCYQDLLECESLVTANISKIEPTD